MPVRIGWPYPPAPTSAPSVAKPTLSTAAVLIPARIAGDASGSSMCHSRNHGDSPSATADS